MERITSRTNPLCTHIRKLNTSNSYRREQGVLVGEGPKLLEEALKAGSEISLVVTAEGVEVSCPSEIRHVEVPADLLASLCDTKTPQGVLFVCKAPETELPVLTGQRYLVLDGVQDPGNVGTVWRTADAFGADGLTSVATDMPMRSIASSANFFSDARRKGRNPARRVQPERTISRTEAGKSRWAGVCWGRYPIPPARSSGARVKVPAAMGCKPTMAFTRVDLPDPFSPTTQR